MPADDVISIHALRMEGDDDADDDSDLRWEISIHALRMEGDVATEVIFPANDVISIHALRMEGDVRLLDGEAEACISIHALRMEGDISHQIGTHHQPIFQSTPSVWRATR